MAHAVCLGFDFDAVSGWIHGYDAANSPTKLSRGEYGARVGVPRILDRRDVAATFFTPGHTIESYPDISGEIHDRGHSIQHHGWRHTSPREFESADAERADIERGIRAIRDLTGSPPTGYRSPSWDSRRIPSTFSATSASSGTPASWATTSNHPLRETTDVDPDEPYSPGPETDIVETMQSHDDVRFETYSAVAERY